MAGLWHLCLNLAAYFTVNLCLSTFNKLVLNQCATPWFLTGFHATFTAIGCFICLKRRLFTLTPNLSRQEHLTLMAFSCLFTVNIAMSNISLSYASLAFHQVARSTGPIFTVLLYRIWYKKVYTVPVYLALLATSVGVMMATYGDVSSTKLGIILTFASMVLATVKSIATNQLLTENLEFHPFEVLLRMCPWAAVQSFVCGYLSGELAIVNKLLESQLLTPNLMKLMTADFLLAFAQNISSFYTNKIAGVVTITVCANLKQLCTIILAIRLFETSVNLMSAAGIIVALSGTAWYSWLVVQEQTNSSVIREEDDSNGVALLPLRAKT